MKIKDELVLQGMTQAAADEIEYNTMGAFQTSDKNTHGYYIVNGQVMHIPSRKNINAMHSILQL